MTAPLPASDGARERDGLRREGAGKALQYASALIARLPVRDPQPGETPAEWQGGYRALVEAQLDQLALQIERGELNLAPLPGRARHG
jgi:hypothetical protein